MSASSPADEPQLRSEAGEDARKHAPAVQRNRDVIASVLINVLPRDGLVLELASGSGEHAVHFASLFPGLTWQPSDPDQHALASIEAWRSRAGLANLLQPLRIDAAAPEWPIKAADAMVCINMSHISPWSATEGLIAGAQRLLKSGPPSLSLRAIQTRRNGGCAQQCCVRRIIARAQSRLGPAGRRRCDRAGSTARLWPLRYCRHAREQSLHHRLRRVSGDKSLMLWLEFDLVNRARSDLIGRVAKFEHRQSIVSFPLHAINRTPDSTGAPATL